MAKFEIESYLTVTLRRVHVLEADSADEAQELFYAEGERGELLSEETVRLIGDEEVSSVKEQQA